MTTGQYPPPGVRHGDLLNTSDYGHPNYMAVVEHGSNAAMARPLTHAAVLWKGTVYPTNALAGDITVRTDLPPSSLYVVRTGAQTLLDSGTMAQPTYSFSSDPSSGMYRSSNNQITIGAGNYAVATFSGLPGSRWVTPGVDNAIALGQPSLRWSTVYAATGTINTSDETLKDNITETPLGLDFVLALEPIRWTFVDGTRPHDGFGAEQVRQALDSAGVEDAALFIDPTVEDPDSEDPKGLRYNEFIAPLVRAMQEQQALIVSLTERVKRLES